MNIFNKLTAKIPGVKQEYFVFSPVSGDIVTLSEIRDGVFSEEILGKGCGIIPSDGIVTAPFAGEIVQIAETKHAIGIQSKEGIELLIHIGLDTVTMNGIGFNINVKTGDKVKCGQKLMTFSIEEIEKAGFRSITAVIVTNSGDYKSVELLKTGKIENTEKIMFIS